MKQEIEELHIISTHSLTRRLTLSADSVLLRILISTHSLTRRLTLCICDLGGI